MSDTEKIPFTKSFVFHPEMEEAAIEYRQGNKNAFSEAVRGHREALLRGERFWEGSDLYDAALIDLSDNLTSQYINRTGDIKPKTKRRKGVEDRVRHWTDIPLGRREEK